MIVYIVTIWLIKAKQIKNLMSKFEIWINKYLAKYKKKDRKDSRMIVTPHTHIKNVIAAGLQWKAITRKSRF